MLDIESQLALARIIAQIESLVKPLNSIMKFDVLTKDNFAIYATKAFDVSTCSSLDEFNSEMRRIQSGKRAITRWLSGMNNVRMMLNHFVIMTNVFGALPACRMSFFIADEQHYSTLKTIFLYLGILPDEIPEVNLNQIEPDMKLEKALEEI